MSKSNLEQMLRMCAKPLVNPGSGDGDDEMTKLQQKSLHEVTHELVRQVTSPNTMVREQVRSGKTSKNECI